MALDATLGGAAANAYLDVDAAALYFATRTRPDAWTNAGAEDRARALVTATTRLEQESYVGTKASTAQALKWPREGALDDEGEAYASATIPAPVLRACCEVALALLAAGDADALAPAPVPGIKELTTSSGTTLVFRDAPVATALGAAAIPAPALRELRGLLRTPPGATPVRRGA